VSCLTTGLKGRVEYNEADMGSVEERTFVVILCWLWGQNAARNRHHAVHFLSYFSEGNWDPSRDTTSLEGYYESIRFLTDHILRPFGYPSSSYQAPYGHWYRQLDRRFTPLVQSLLLADSSPHPLATTYSADSSRRQMEEACGEYCWGT
jgi:hypothetical protein